MKFQKNPEDFNTVKDVAERLKLLKSQVYTLLDEGKIKHFKFGKKKGIRIRESDLLEYQRRCAVDFILGE